MSWTPYWPVRGDDPYIAVGTVHHLAAAVASPNWEETFTAYARCARIVRGIDCELPLQPAAYQEKVEHELHSALESAAAKLEKAGDAAELLGQVLAELTAPINSFFDTVLVNAEEEDVRLARQALVQRIAQIPAHGRRPKPPARVLIARTVLPEFMRWTETAAHISAFDGRMPQLTEI